MPVDARRAATLLLLIAVCGCKRADPDDGARWLPPELNSSPRTCEWDGTGTSHGRAGMCVFGGAVYSCMAWYRDGWTVMQSAALVTAVRGDRFVITNSREWMDQRLDPDAKTEPLPISAGGFLAGGVITQGETPYFSWSDPGVTGLTGHLPPKFKGGVERWGQIRQVSWEPL